MEFVYLVASDLMYRIGNFFGDSLGLLLWGSPILVILCLIGGLFTTSTTKRVFYWVAVSVAIITLVVFTPMIIVFTFLFFSTAT